MNRFELWLNKENCSLKYENIIIEFRNMFHLIVAIILIQNPPTFNTPKPMTMCFGQMFYRIQNGILQ